MSLQYYILFWLYKLHISERQVFSVKNSNNFDRDFALSLLKKNPIITFRISPEEVIDNLEYLYSYLEFDDYDSNEFAIMNKFSYLYYKKSKSSLLNILHDLVVKPAILIDFAHLSANYSQLKIEDYIDENKELSYTYFVIRTLSQQDGWDKINVFLSDYRGTFKSSCIYMELHFRIILIKIYYRKPEWKVMQSNLERFEEILDNNINTIPNEVYIKYKMFIDTFNQLCRLAVKVGWGDSCYFDWEELIEIENTQLVDIKKTLKYYLENSVIENKWLYEEYEDMLE